VLEPLGGYLHPGRHLRGPKAAAFCKSWNFGPNNSANKNVGEVVKGVIRHWGSGNVVVERDPNSPHEDHWLQLNCDRANQYLNWSPTWNYSDSIAETVSWYRRYHEGADISALTDSQIEKYSQAWKAAGRD